MAFSPLRPDKGTAAAALAAFRVTLPILVGFGFCGFSYGLYMHSLGFAPIVPVIMATTILAGSLEFIMASMLIGPFAPLTAFTVGLVVNARHLFYGIAMLDAYRGAGMRKGYLVCGLIDETFSILQSEPVPEGLNRHQYAFFVTLFNHSYWVFSTAAGAYFGSALPFSASSSTCQPALSAAAPVMLSAEPASETLPCAILPRSPRAKRVASP